MTLYPRHASGPAGRRSCFTLLELLVVIAVITILVGIVIGGVGIANRKAAEAKTRALLTQLEIAFDQYKQQFGYFPQWSAPTTAAAWAPINQRFVRGTSTDMGLESAAPAPRGKYFLDVATLTFTGTDTTSVNTGTSTYVGPDKTLVDAFDKPIYYRCPGFQNQESYDLWSAGADGKYGTSAATPSTATDATNAATDASDDITNWKRN
jgi:type II secretory pathway pseudopilin PulG